METPQGYREGATPDVEGPSTTHKRPSLLDDDRSILVVVPTFNRMLNGGYTSRRHRFLDKKYRCDEAQAVCFGPNRNPSPVVGKASTTISASTPTAGIANRLPSGPVAPPLSQLGPMAWLVNQ